MTTPAGKKSRNDDDDDFNDVESNDSHTTDYDYAKTEMDDVFLCDKLPKLKRAREDLNDDDDPVFLILTNKTRNLFLDMIRKLKDSEKKTKDADTQTDSIIIQPQNEVETEMIDDNGSNVTTFDMTNAQRSNVTTFDMTNAQQLKEDYANVINCLQDVQRQFRDSQLKSDIDNHSDLNAFRDIRRKITKMYVHGSKMLKNIEKISTGDHECLFQVETNIKPTFIGKENISKIVSDLDDTVKTINAKLFNVSVENCKDEICEVLRLISCTDPLLIAKAWRTSQKNPNVDQEYRIKQPHRTDNRSNNRRPNYSNRMNDRPNYPTRNDDRRRTFYNQTYRQRPHSYRRENFYDRQDSNRYRRNYRDYNRTDYYDNSRNYQRRSYRYDETEFPRLPHKRDSYDNHNDAVFLEEDDYYSNRRKHY